MDNKEQLNVIVPKDLAKRLRVDATQNNRTLSDVVTVIFSDFLKSWSQTERRKFYEKSPTKKAGRKIVLRKAA